MASDNGKTAYRKWYQSNKQAFNAKRKAKYHSDPEVREKAINNAKKYRESNPREKEEKHFREINGKQVEVFRIGATAEFIGRSEQSIREWQRKGWIPPCTIDSDHRYFTIKQIKLLQEFADFVSQVRYDRAIRELAIKKKSSELYMKWGS